MMMVSHLQGLFVPQVVRIEWGIIELIICCCYFCLLQIGF